MFEYVKILDNEITIFLNNYHNNILDYLMILISNKYIWIPLYLFLIYVLFKIDKKNIISHILLCILSVIISDYITSSLMKPFFEILRPCYNENLKSTINIVAECGGRYGFASSHASTTFSLATCFYLISSKKIKLLFIWSLIVGYSRIYLGVHFFSDVIFGFFIGIITSIIIFHIFKKYFIK
mgnify:FL=1